MATKKIAKKARNLKLRVTPKVASKSKPLAAPKSKPPMARKAKPLAPLSKLAKSPKRKRGNRKAKKMAPIAPVAKAKPVRKRGLSPGRRKQLEFARKKKFERLVTEKTLRDILALRCVQRCTG
jgi:hypothetical protein